MVFKHSCSRPVCLNCKSIAKGVLYLCITTLWCVDNTVQSYFRDAWLMCFVLLLKGSMWHCCLPPMGLSCLAGRWGLAVIWLHAQPGLGGRSCWGWRPQRITKLLIFIPDGLKLYSWASFKNCPYMPYLSGAGQFYSIYSDLRNGMLPNDSFKWLVYP